MQILSVKSDKDTFKEVILEPGFNVILAERTKESSSKDSRNGLGKSSLIHIIRFCLGSGINKTLESEKLSDWTFTVDIELAGKNYSISRNTGNKSKIIIDGDCSEWPIKPEVDSFGNTRRQIMSAADWVKVLGKLSFDMDFSYPDFSYVPTFGSCRAYFVRNSEEGGMLDPFKQRGNQLEWDKQINNAFLLGLDWTYASKWQVLKDRKKIINQLKNEAQSGMLKDMEGSIGELEAKKIRLENEITKQTEQLKNFNVHPQYQGIERETNDITVKIHDLSNDNISDKSLLDYYESSFEEERDVDVNIVNKVYEEAGVVLPDGVKKRLEDVKEFHKKVIVNRKDFLVSEITRLKENLNKRNEEKLTLCERRKELFEILNSHKALDEYTKMQQYALKLTSEFNDISKRIDNLKKFEQGKSALKIDLELVQQEARVSLDERSEIKNKAINQFNANSEILYESPGNLSIDVSSNGYEFGVTIEREGSHGIKNMKILCYDLMLSQLWADKGMSFPLIHDSVLFADVDERQVALALELAAKEAESRGFQYICTLNSDIIPYSDFSTGFDIKKFVRKTFTDSSEDGGLFGIRF